MLIQRYKLKKYIFIVFMLLVVGYAYFEARNVLYGPRITLANEDGAITVSESTVEVSGVAHNVVEITLSGNPIFIDDQGNFTETRTLSLGLNRLEFEARDKFGRVKTDMLEIIYEPKAPEQTPENTDTIEE